MTKTSTSAEKVRVAIIGAGMAGLRAARHLNESGQVDFAVFEASSRVGGRVYPFIYEDGYLQYGAEFINGVDNEIYRLAKSKNILDTTTLRVEDQYLLDDRNIVVVDGKTVDSEILQKWIEFASTAEDKMYKEVWNVPGKSVGERFDRIVRQWNEENNATAEEQKIYDELAELFRNYFQTEWSSPIDELAMSNLDTWDDGTVDGDDSAQLDKFGFYEILKYFKDAVPKDKIRLQAKVININYEGPKVILSLSSGERLPFDAVIVTTSLGYLKRHHSTLFSPDLDEKKTWAIKDMGYGNNMKVFLEFDKPWWPADTPSILIRRRHGSHSNGTEHSKLLDNLMVFQPSPWAHKILIAWIAGSGPNETAVMSDTELRDVIDRYLHDNLREYNVTNVKRIYRHNWITDEFALGTYSYFTPASYEDHDDDVIKTLSQPIFRRSKPVVCFAGEHTDGEMYQTTVGAARSGLREAERILRYYGNNNQVIN